MRIAAVGGRHHLDMFASTADGGSLLGEVITARYPGVTVDLVVEEVAGFDELRRRLAAGSFLSGDQLPDVVILSVDDEVRRLPQRAADPAAAVAAAADDLMAITDYFKGAGVRVLVANACTVDPEASPLPDATGIEPIGLRAHRLDLMLVQVSHSDGISVIDVDRSMAEIGAAENLSAPMVYGPAACARIIDDTVTILDDYGFFDDRPLLEQVGSGRKSGPA
ncbi:MAG: hypothetical protein M3349_07825 [Actinomycetota bacterium]|nr:hypothetical protein [Actinomycetota bacterium]